MIINHEVNCNGFDETTFYHLPNLTLKGNQITSNVNQVAVDDIIEYYDLQIAQLDSKSLSKRSTHQLSAPINLNFENGKAKDTNVTIFQGTATQLNCLNCFSNGNINFMITANGTRTELADYTFQFNGTMFSTMDVDARVLAADNQFLKKVTLFTAALTPITVKGLFNVGPSITLDAGVSYSLTTPVDFTFGFDFNYDFDFTSTPHQKPQFKQLPQFKRHNFTLSKDIQGSVSLHLIPAINLNLEVLKKFTLDTLLPIDTSVGLELDTGKFKRCCPNGKYNVAVISQTDLSITSNGKAPDDIFKPFSETFDIFNTGKLTLAKFCQARLK